jgi:hypothetical protein
MRAVNVTYMEKMCANFVKRIWKKETVQYLKRRQYGA